MSEKKEERRERMRDWFDWLSGRKKPEPEPDMPVEPPKKQPGLLELWRTIRGLKVKDLAPAIFTVPVIVFLAVSGFVMWCVLVLKFIASLIRTALGL